MVRCVVLKTNRLDCVLTWSCGRVVGKPSSPSFRSRGLCLFCSSITRRLYMPTPWSAYQPLGALVTLAHPPTLSATSSCSRSANGRLWQATCLPPHPDQPANPRSRLCASFNSASTVLDSTMRTAPLLLPCHPNNGQVSTLQSTAGHPDLCRQSHF